jgi:hypothetical protein
MIVWTGAGIVTVVIGILGFIIAIYLPDSIAGTKDYHEAHPWVWLIGMGIAAALNYGLFKLTAQQKVQVVYDKDTGKELHLRKSHSLFFIPIKWWTFIFIFFGMLFGLFSSQPQYVRPGIKQKTEQADAPNSHAFGTFVTDPADAGSAPKASGSR